MPGVSVRPSCSAASRRASHRKTVESDPDTALPRVVGRRRCREQARCRGAQPVRPHSGGGCPRCSSCQRPTRPLERTYRAGGKEKGVFSAPRLRARRGRSHRETAHGHAPGGHKEVDRAQQCLANLAPGPGPEDDISNLDGLPRRERAGHEHVRRPSCFPRCGRDGQDLRATLSGGLLLSDPPQSRARAARHGNRVYRRTPPNEEVPLIRLPAGSSSSVLAGHRPESLCATAPTPAAHSESPGSPRRYPRRAAAARPPQPTAFPYRCQWSVFANKEVRGANPARSWCAAPSRRRTARYAPDGAHLVRSAAARRRRRPRCAPRRT